MPLCSGLDEYTGHEPTREQYDMREEQEAEWSATRELIVAPMQSGPGGIYAALAAFQGEVGMIHKDGRNEFHKYNYASLEQWVEVLRPALAKHGLSVITTCERVEDLPSLETNRGGALRLVRVTAVAVVMHVSGGAIRLSAYGEGSDSGDKAVYKAMTGARKYLLAALSGSATSDDPEDEKQSPRARQKEYDDTGRAGTAKEHGAPKPKVSLGAGTPPARPVTPHHLITKPQASRLWAIWSKRFEAQCPSGSAEMKLEQIKAIVGAFGYEHTAEIKRDDYEAICAAAEGWLPPDSQVPDPKWDK